MIKIKSIIGFGLFVCSMVAHAADHEITVCKLQAHTGTDVVYLTPCGVWQSQSSCAGDYFVAWNMSQGNGKAMYNTATTALLHGKTVSVRLTDNVCVSGYDATNMIRIFQ